MKCVTTILLVLFYCTSQFSSLSDASVAASRPNPLRKPGGCYERNTGHLTAGQEITIPGQCTSALCGAGGGISYYSCGSIQVEGPCRVTPTDFSKPYPQCCPRIEGVCTGAKGSL